MGQLSQDQINIDLFDEVKRLREENQLLKDMLSKTMDDFQRIRENSNHAHSSVESSIRDYFERVKQIQGR